MDINKRTGWIDIARAFAIIFVIYGHIGNELTDSGIIKDSVFGIVAQVTNPVKLPLFFSISGFLFSDKNSDTAYFIKRELKTRFIPYLIWGTFMGLVAYGMDLYRFSFDKSQLLPLLWANYIGPLIRGNLIWFIPCLLVLEIIFFLMLKVTRKNLVALTVTAVVLTAVGYIVSGRTNVPWKVDTALVCTQFMTFGYLLKRFFGCEGYRKNKKWIMALFPIAFAAVLFAEGRIWEDCRVDMNTGVYFNPLGFTVLALLGVMAVFAVSMLIGQNKILRFIGRNTLTYFIWHMYAVKVILGIISFAGFGSLLTRLPMSVTALAVTVISLAGVALICAVVNRYFGFSIGLQKTKITTKERT